MKKLFLLLLVAIVCSCSNSDSPTVTVDKIVGKWKMTSATQQIKIIRQQTIIWRVNI